MDFKTLKFFFALYGRIVCSGCKQCDAFDGADQTLGYDLCGRRIDSE